MHVGVLAYRMNWQYINVVYSRAVIRNSKLGTSICLLWEYSFMNVVVHVYT